jgi:hypothetical protein
LSNVLDDEGALDRAEAFEALGVVVDHEQPVPAVSSTWNRRFVDHRSVRSLLRVLSGQPSVLCGLSDCLHDLPTAVEHRESLGSGLEGRPRESRFGCGTGLRVELIAIPARRLRWTQKPDCDGDIPRQSDASES